MSSSSGTAWWALSRHPAEPSRLYRLFVIGVISMVVGFGLSGIVASWSGLWKFQNPPQGETRFQCKEQLEYRTRTEDDLQQQIWHSKERLHTLRMALLDPASQHYALARQAIDDEERFLNKTQAQAAALQVEPLSEGMLLVLSSMFLTVVLCFVVARLMLAHGSSAVKAEPLRNWHIPCLWLSAVFALLFIAREIVTSVLTVKNSWFSWSSFCICTPAWYLDWISSTGVALMAAYPATLIWCFSRPSCRPKLLVFSAPDGSCGVGDYLLFLQTWSVSVLLFVMAGSAVWVDFLISKGRFSPEYLIAIAGLAGVALLVAGRLTWNAVKIRLLYRNELRASGPSWAAIMDQKPPADPTINFLGEHWWKLPATVLAALTALWAIANLLLPGKLTIPQ